MEGIEFLKLRYPNLYRRLNEIADEKETKSKNEDSHNLLKKKLAAYQAELEGDLETVEKDDKVQDADQALTDGQLKEELDNVEKGGDHDKVQDADQASIDLLFGILRDWTYIAAGAPGPWTRHPETPLGKLVSDQYERIGPARPMPSQVERSQPAAGVFVSPGSSGCLPTLTVIENRHRSDPRRYRDRPVHMGMTMTEFPGSSRLSSLLRRRRLSRYRPNNIANNASLQAEHRAQLALFALSSATHPSPDISPSKATSATNNDIDSEGNHSAAQPNTGGHQPSQMALVSGPDHSLNGSFRISTPHTTDLEFHNTEAQPVMTRNRSTDPWWPKTFPVECFRVVAKYLSRDDLKACLETSKEFNRNFGPTFFQQVVLQFDTQTFDPVNGHESLLQAQLNLTSSSEGSLPTDKKASQGFYPKTFVWPETHSYVDPSTKKLEIAAEKIKPMQEAIAHLTNVNELALSLDSGLGWLSGPDASDRVKIFTDKSEVFGRKNAQSREQMAREWLEFLEVKVSDLPNRDKSIFGSYEKSLRLVSPHCSHYLHVVVDYMRKYARGSLDITDSQVCGHVKKHLEDNDLLADGQNIHVYNDIVDLLEIVIGCLKIGFLKPMPEALSTPGGPTLHSKRRGVQRHKGAFRMFDSRQYTSSTASPSRGVPSATVTCQLDRRHLGRLVSTEPTIAAIFGGIDFEEGTDPSLADKKPKPPSLEPSNLSLRQKQWLKEFGWVQNALIGSLITSVIRNSTNLATIHTLNLAKLSSSFLGRLYDDDFWNSLPNLRNLIMMVSPDWREIVAAYEGDFQAHEVNPSRTVTSFYQLLIGLSKRKSIESLTLGYVGGGEHATGLFARNRHLLPAPIVDSSAATTVIAFPHVKRLKFKNCWFVPAVLDNFIGTMEHLLLKSLKFESVSLLAADGQWIKFPFNFKGWPSGFPPQQEQGSTPIYVGFGVPQPSAITLALKSALEPMTLDADGQPCPAEDAQWWNQVPHKTTWARFINEFTPGLTVDEKRTKWLGRHSRKRKRAMQEANQHLGAKRGKIPFLEFVSCGYAKLVIQDLGSNVNVLASHVALPDPDNEQLEKRKTQLAQYMMTSNDPFLADILPLISEQEAMLLTEAFGMTLGWGDDHCQFWNGEDGKALGGTGRFSGVLWLGSDDDAGDDSSDGDVA